ncbi:MAG TPA: helix-turn-helix domain-containing protein [Streptosporangiaceae bacterium]
MTERSPAAVGHVANPGRQRDLGRENAVLRELVTVYRQLSGLALQDADLASVTQLIADRTAATVAVVSPVMDVIAAASPGTPAEKAAALIQEAIVHPRLGQVLRASREGHRPLWLPSVGGMPPVIVAPVLVGDEVPAHLITMEAAGADPAEDMRLLVTEHAATICGVILGRENVVAAAARRVRDDLVEGLLLGRGRDDGETGRWAAHLGYDPSREHNVLAIAFDLPPPRPGLDAAALRQRVCDVIEQFFTTRAPDVIVSVREAEVVLVTTTAAAQADGRSTRRLADTCLARLAELFPDTRALIGIGGPCRRPGEITRSYQEAHRTLETLRRLGRAGAVTAFADLGIHRLLLQVPDLAELRAFADDVLGTLTRADRDRHADYLTTLACYLRENGSPQRAARFLHVHPNTVAYRVKRIEELTGLSLDSYQDRLSTQVALEILDALGFGGGGP